MYLQHFGLSELPFSITPDTQFYLNRQAHRQALNTLLVALKHCEGFIKIVGEVGTGKTLLCRILMAHLKNEYLIVYIPNPYLSPDELKNFIAKQVGANFIAGMPGHEILSALYRRLLQLDRQGKQVVLLVDEAQAMPRDTIESLRLLTNLETEKRKLLQVVMIGQPELDKVLARKDLRQLNQRILFSEYLCPLDRAGVRDYIAHRLSSAGLDEGKLFSRTALNLVFWGSGGIPRLINILCHKALMVAYGKGHKRIGSWHIAKAIADTRESHWSGRLLSNHLRFLFHIPILRERQI